MPYMDALSWFTGRSLTNTIGLWNTGILEKITLHRGVIFSASYLSEFKTSDVAAENCQGKTVFLIFLWRMLQWINNTSVEGSEMAKSRMNLGKKHMNASPIYFPQHLDKNLPHYAWQFILRSISKDAMVRFRPKLPWVKPQLLSWGVEFSTCIHTLSQEPMQKTFPPLLITNYIGTNYLPAVF